MPLFSLIVPTRDRKHELTKMLWSVISVCGDTVEAEVLVVDNGSTDGTIDTVSRISNEMQRLDLRYIYEPVPGQLSGRHRGATESRSDVVVFLDDDVVLSSSWLNALRDCFLSRKVDIAGGPSLGRYASQPPAWLKCFEKETPYGGTTIPELSLLNISTDSPIRINPTWIWGLNLAIRKELLFDAGGFNPDVVPPSLQHFQGDGETGLAHKLVARSVSALYHPDLRVDHQIGGDRMIPEYFDRRYFYQGVCDSYSRIRQDGRICDTKVMNQGSGNFNAALRHLASRARSLIGRFLGVGRYGSSSDHSLSDYEILHARFGRAYLRGFEFHREAVRRSPRLLQWVCSENYLNYTYPELESRFVVPPRQVHESENV